MKVAAYSNASTERGFIDTEKGRASSTKVGCRKLYEGTGKERSSQFYLNFVGTQSVKHITLKVFGVQKTRIVNEISNFPNYPRFSTVCFSVSM
jgi:hypothetical protein